jgi:hypothetical protein
MARRNFIVTVVSMFLIVASTSFAVDKYQWDLDSIKHDCHIYYSEVPGKEYVAAKTTCVFPARIEVVAMVLREIANFQNGWRIARKQKF